MRFIRAVGNFVLTGDGSITGAGGGGTAPFLGGMLEDGEDEAALVGA